MQHLEVSGAVRHIYMSLGFKRLRQPPTTFPLQSVLTLAAYRQATRILIESDGTICCMYTTMSY